MRRTAIGLVLGISLASATPAAAKDFRPGDLRLCGATRCVTLQDQAGLDDLATFYYGSKAPSRARRPPLRAPYFELRFRNGYVTGIVATARLDRFLSYGVNTSRFVGGAWYGVPASGALMLRAAAVGVAPRHLTLSALRKSR